MAGGGTDERYEGSFNVNSFKGARQISAIGMANNTMRKDSHLWICLILAANSIGFDRAVAGEISILLLVVMMPHAMGWLGRQQQWY